MGVCEHVDCEREAVGATGACESHGGLQQCYLCDKWAIRGGKCKRHAIIGGLFECGSTRLDVPKRTLHSRNLRG